MYDRKNAPGAKAVIDQYYFIQGAKRSKQHHKTDYSEISSARDETYGIIEPKQPTMTAEEVEFFDRVKQHINNKATYNEFLKVLNLFSQQLLDQNTLVERVDTFIGNDKKLFKWFKEFVGYDGKDEIVENIPATVSRPDFLQSKSFGQSYRLIPRMVSSYWEQSYSRYPISNLIIFISFNLKPAQAEIHYVVKS